ncbi:GPI ethanolamine phosphate transferase 1 [Ceratocystis platani]|uniref:GPI ethanolamine phosphate transferase 1 n=1 Tax=Ceratocystis fimbriata f. sp. platani TaxID=88771 RepID=A0A0F8B9A3_CERFI|nr:GPI ethanolamine phosphate transferase 1 [Ceratocystis platani]
MAGFPRFGFLAIAVVFHLVYIYSIFDIYFVSPIVSGMRLYGINRPSSTPAPADRLFLFVGDGLRADKAFQSHPEPYPESPEDLVPRPLAPFLRSRILEHGTFGVSHTRVPTESRPGHVALIAGLYEDVSAVTTGWKLNPVNFDSVFNRSRHTWSWGSPDILPMFQHGAVSGRVDADHYEPEFEDFAGDATKLDLWVFDHVQDLFKAAATNHTLDRALREDKVVFFLHLLGLDTTGHSYRPYSKEYLNNIKVVDKGVSEIVHMVQDFYRDDRTAFIFTADHGMSDWGSHGDGHPDNTRTPLIAWGSGVARPVTTIDGSVASGHDEYSADWNLDHIQRHDVAQADVAALMTYLIGTEFPANSVGELPLSFLSANLKEKATAALVNTKGILEMYRVKEEQKNATEMRYRPFSGLDADAQLAPEQRVAAIQSLIDAGKYEEAIEETAVLLKAGLDGLRYLQTYDWLFLRALITVGYLGWMAFALTIVLDLFVLHGATPPSRSLASGVFFSSILTTLYASFIVSKSPFTYYLYAFFPVMFWEEVVARRQSIVKSGEVLFGHISSGSSMIMFAIDTLLYVAVVESLAVGYIHREVLTVLFLVASLWPLSLGWNFIRAHLSLLLTWAFLCIVMSTFTLLPAMKTENLSLILAGGALMAFIGLLYLAFEDYILADFSKPYHPQRQNMGSRVITGVQIGLVLLAMIVTHGSTLSLQAKQGLPRGNQIVGWITLVVSLFMPITYRLYPNSHYMHRLLSMFLTCAPTFIILTISYEGLFYVAFSLILVTWVRLEHRIDVEMTPMAINGVSGTEQNSTIEEDAKDTNHSLDTAPVSVPVYRPLRLSDARVALFFFVLLQSAFFSTGNVASISSFSLDSVYRLIPIFDPFSQGALLVLKLMIPFAVMSANLGVLNKQLRVAPSALFMLTMAVSDILTLYFFWVVKDEGSWLEIGSTISHFVIASLLCAFVAMLEGVSAMFISGMEVNEEKIAVMEKKKEAEESPEQGTDIEDKKAESKKNPSLPQEEIGQGEKVLKSKKSKGKKRTKIDEKKAINSSRGTDAEATAPEESQLNARPSIGDAPDSLPVASESLSAEVDVPIESLSDASLDALVKIIDEKEDKNKVGIEAGVVAETPRPNAEPQLNGAEEGPVAVVI